MLDVVISLILPKFILALLFTLISLVIIILLTSTIPALKSEVCNLEELLLTVLDKSIID